MGTSVRSAVGTVLRASVGCSEGNGVGVVVRSAMGVAVSRGDGASVGANVPPPPLLVMLSTACGSLVLLMRVTS